MGAVMEAAWVCSFEAASFLRGHSLRNPSLVEHRRGRRDGRLLMKRSLPPSASRTPPTLVWTIFARTCFYGERASEIASCGGEEGTHEGREQVDSGSGRVCRIHTSCGAKPVIPGHRVDSLPQRGGHPTGVGGSVSSEESRDVGPALACTRRALHGIVARGQFSARDNAWMRVVIHRWCPSEARSIAHTRRRPVKEGRALLGGDGCGLGPPARRALTQPPSIERGGR
ncbi:hypothetical protein MRX96_003793 [Rhipicephalus microplus]